MSDPIFSSFLGRQRDEGMSLARSSDILELFAVFQHPLPPHLPVGYRAVFHCSGLVRDPVAGVVPADHFEVGIRFPFDYLRRADPGQVLCLLHPRNVWHPNVALHAPFICAGRLPPGTSLVDILYQVFEILTWRKFALGDPLNPEASQWARDNLDRGLFPTDPRPLKRRSLGLRLEAAQAEKTP